MRPFNCIRTAQVYVNNSFIHVNSLFAIKWNLPSRSLDISQIQISVCGTQPVFYSENRRAWETSGSSLVHPLTDEVYFYVSV